MTPTASSSTGSHIWNSQPHHFGLWLMRSGSSQWGSTGGYCFQLLRQPLRWGYHPQSGTTAPAAAAWPLLGLPPAELKPPSVSTHGKAPDWGFGAQFRASQTDLQQLNGLFFYRIIHTRGTGFTLCSYLLVPHTYNGVRGDKTPNEHFSPWKYHFYAQAF